MLAGTGSSGDWLQASHHSLSKCRLPCPDPRGSGRGGAESWGAGPIQSTPSCWHINFPAGGSITSFQSTWEWIKLSDGKKKMLREGSKEVLSIWRDQLQEGNTELGRTPSSLSQESATTTSALVSNKSHCSLKDSFTSHPECYFMKG